MDDVISDYGIDYRQFNMTVDEYAAATAFDSVEYLAELLVAENNPALYVIYSDDPIINFAKQLM